MRAPYEAVSGAIVRAVMSRSARLARLRELGFASYNDYLGSTHWAFIRARYVRKFGRSCEHCGAGGDHLHHKTYDRLGAEDLEDLIFLCAKCHREVHGIGKKKTKPKKTHPTRTRVAKKKHKKRKNEPTRDQIRAQEERKRREEQKKGFVPYRPPVGGGIPRKIVLSDGTIKRSC